MKSKTSNSKNDNTKNTIKSSSSDVNNTKAKGVVWDLEPILAKKNSDTHLKEIDSMVETFKKYRSILNDKITAQKLLEIVKLEENISIRLGRVEAYYALKFYADTKDSAALSKMGQLKHISAKIGNDIMFFNLWFIHLDDAVAKKLLDTPILATYKYHLESIRRDKPYIKSEEIERILNIKDITGGHAYAELYEIMTNSYMFEWFGKKLSKEEIINYYRDNDPKLREKSYELMLSRYGEDSIILSEIYKNVVSDWCNEGIQIRGHKNSINIRNNSYDVSDKSVDALLKVVRKNAKLFAEYFKLKYSMNTRAGQKYPYSRYHLYAPFITKTDKKYSYEESKTIVLDTFKKFDPRFYDRALRIFNDNHVHSHPAPTKRGGAFCNSITREITPYILLNHTNGLRDLSTMMHEMGHGVHDVFAGEKQTDLERHASLTICETASVFSEMLLSERLLKESKDNEEKKFILTSLLDNNYATIIRQAYFVIFELYAHEKIVDGATKESLDEYYYGLLKEQFGDMQVPEVFKHEWNYIPHIHETPFYCYAYAWGNLFVLALYDMYKKDNKGFVDKYIDLLSAGGSDSPANLMKKLGIDAESEEFWQRGFDIIKEQIEELKRLA